MCTCAFPGQFPGSDFESHQPYEEPHRESRTFTRWAWVNTHKQTHSRCVVRCCLSSMCVISLNWPQGSTAAPHQNISTNCQGLISGKNCLLYLSFITFILKLSAFHGFQILHVHDIIYFVPLSLFLSQFRSKFKTITPVLYSDWFTNFDWFITTNLTSQVICSHFISFICAVNKDKPIEHCF